MSGLFRVGTSGWHYPHWKGVFYPENMPTSRWLQHYAEIFDTVEINNSFYKLPSLKTFASWKEQVPEGFLFTVKANRFITHVKRLKDCGQPVQRMLDNAAGLDDKLGPILFQLPPRFKAKGEVFEEFLRLLPQGGRYVFEFRDESWFSEFVYSILREYGCALCIASSPIFDEVRKITTSFSFLRFHGGSILYGSNYSDEELEEWADFASGLLRENIDVYAYFNNDAYGYAVQNALTFRKMVEDKTGMV